MESIPHGSVPLVGGVGVTLAGSSDTQNGEALHFDASSATGPFYVEVSGPANGQVYSLVYSTAEPSVVTPGTDDANEPDNSLGEADARGVLPPGTTFVGTTWDDEDYFRIEIPAGLETVHIAATCPDDLDVYLVDSQGTTLQGTTLAGAATLSGKEFLTFTVPAGGGTYYILVEHWGSLFDVYAVRYWLTAP